MCNGLTLQYKEEILDMLVMYGARKSLEPLRQLAGSLVTTFRSGRIERGEWLMITGLCSVGHLPGHCPGGVREESLDVGGWEIDCVGGGGVAVHLNAPCGENLRTTAESKWRGESALWSWRSRASSWSGFPSHVAGVSRE